MCCELVLKHHNYNIFFYSILGGGAYKNLNKSINQLKVMVQLVQDTLNIMSFGGGQKIAAQSFELLPLFPLTSVDDMEKVNESIKSATDEYRQQLVKLKI